MTYTYKCMKCYQPWNGAGMVCNSCRQIEAIEKQTKSLSNLGTSNYSQPSMFANDTELERILNSYDDSNMSQRERDLGRPLFIPSSGPSTPIPAAPVKPNWWAEALFVIALNLASCYAIVCLAWWVLKFLYFGYWTEWNWIGF